MWFPVTLLLLAGVAVVTSASDHEHAWETGNEYEYHVRSRTVAGLDKMKQQYTGVEIKAKLIVQVKSPQILQVKLSNPQYARLHTTLVDGPNTELPDQMLEYHQIAMSEKPIEVTMKHGVIRDLLVDRDIPTWELNLLKSIMSQLQIDTQGENAVGVKSAQIPIDENSPVIFTAVEDSVGGRCEVLYEIIPLHDAHHEMPDKIPLPNLRGEGSYYDVKKVKNYEKCLQRQIYHHGLEDPLLRKQGKLHTQDKIISELSTTQMLLSGNLKEFTIQSVVTKNQISVKPGKTDPFLGNVHSILKLTLVKMDIISSPMLGPMQSTNLESTGNLIYTYNDPFSDSENPMSPSVSINSGQIKSSESSSSSEKDMDDWNSSSSSSSEDHTLYMSNISPKRMAMHMAPKSPLLSFMTVTNVGQVEDLIHEIAVTIHSSNDTRLSITEKYIFLKNFIRIMSLKQISELEERVSYNPRIENKDYKNIVWSIIRDVVTQAGTGPALLTIQTWVKNKKVEGLEAARIMSQIPKYVHKPTKEYVRTFYEIISDPSVLHQTTVNVTAPLAFAEVLRKSHVDMSSQTRSWRRLGPMTLRGNTEVVDLYIPHLAEQMKQGLMEDNSPKIQTYITALGMTGNPKIISIFEPYIEGTEPVSKFQRLLMVSSLSTLSKFQPKLVGPIFYKLYSNVNEDHKIRCMSIYRYIMSNPPLIMLQRVAKFTHNDLDENVNSVVKSAIMSLSNTKRPELQDLAIKARSVRHLLNSKEFGKWNSKGLYMDLDLWSIRGFSVQTIQDDSIIPSFLSVAVNTAFDFYGLPTEELGYAVSSAKQLLNYLNIRQNEETSQELLQKSRIENLMQILQLKPKHLDKLEGYVFANTIYSLLFYPYDSQTLRKISSQWRDSLKKDQQMDLVLFNSFETMLSFPTESGLPFIYTLESPMVLKLKAEMRNGELSNTKTGIWNMYVANKAQKRFGFITPFEHQNYIAGVDVNRMIQLPLEYEVELDMTQQKIDIGRLNIRPQTQISPVTVLRLSTVPFTSRQDLHDLQPLSISRSTHLVLTEKKHKIMLEKDLISVRVESDNKEAQENLVENDIVQLWMKLQMTPTGQYQKFDIIMNPEQLEKSVLRTNVVHEKIAVDTKQRSLEPESQIMFSLKHVKPNSEKRRKEVMTGFSKNLNSGDVHVVDINLNLPALEKQHVVTVGWMDSNVDKKSKVYLYWNSQMSMKEKPTSEVCYTHEIQHSPDTPLNFEHMMKHAPKDKVKAELRYGDSCSRGNKIVVDASMSRNHRIKDLLENSKVVKQCLEEIQKGHNALQACQQATELARVKNQLDVSVGGSITNYIRQVITKISDFLSHLFPRSHVKVINPEDSDRNTYDIEMTMSPMDIVPPTYLDSSQVDVTFPNMGQTNSEMQELLKENTMLRKEAKRASCTIDKNMVFTFDKLIYPVTLGTCKHVMMTAYPQKDLDNPNDIEMAVLVLIYENVDGTKGVNLLTEKNEVELTKVNDDIKVKIDGVPIELSQEKSYEQRQDGEIVLEIIELPDSSIEVISHQSDIRIVFDGERIQLLVSDRYRNALRGLCGNYDSNPNTDFLTPQNCLMKMPEVFTSTYALTEEGCQQKYIMENKQRAQLVQCQELPTHRRNNVINDIEAGRLPTHSELWGYHHDNLKKKHNLNYDIKKYSVEKKDSAVDSNIVYRTKVVLEDEEICFTTKPIPVCREGSRSLERKTKKYDLYCQPRNEESQLMKRRVEQGANPDFTRKPVSRLRTFQVPVVCNA